MCRVTELDRIRNERIRGTTKVGEIAKKVLKRRLKWYGHVMRGESYCVGRGRWKWKCRGGDREEGSKR